MDNDFIIENGVLMDYRGSGGDVVIPNSVTVIGNSAFYNRTNLTSITISDSVTSIGEWAFAYCRNLASVVIPDSVTYIGKYSFCSCKNLISVTIGSNVTIIGRLAFAYCCNLTNITIPNSITYIGRNAFYHCIKLTSNNKNLRFKATDGNMCCRKFQYSLNNWFEFDGKIKLCWRGFHACKNPLDIFNYYYGEIGKNVRLWLVETDEETEENDDDSKVVSGRIRFVKELTISELVNYTNRSV